MTETLNNLKLNSVKADVRKNCVVHFGMKDYERYAGIT